MKPFQMHTFETAPEAARPALEDARKSLGFVPNLYGILAESPAALESYVQVTALLDNLAALSAPERHLVAVAISRDSDCEYCVAAHCTVGKMVEATDEDLNVARDGTESENPKLAALLRFATALVNNRGQISEEALADFYSAGYEQRHVLDVVTVAALKTLSNFTNLVAKTPVDEAFAAHKWAGKSAGASD